MSDSVNVRITGKLREFIDQQTSKDGLYESASEYLRALVRQDYEAREAHKWTWLYEQLKPGMEADWNEFSPLDVEEMLSALHAEADNGV